MLQTLLQFSFFLGLGIAWRYVQPMQVSSAALQRSFIAVLYNVMLPALIISVLWTSKLSGKSVQTLAVMLATTAAGLAAAWFYYKNKSISANVKGALILAAGFGGVLLIGLPISTDWVARWTVRTAVYYEGVILLPILFVAGLFLSSEYAQRSKASVAVDLIKEPIIIAVILGFGLNLLAIKMPVLVANWLNVAKLGILPMGLMTIGLSMYWQKSWAKLLPVMWPAVAIQLVLTPLLMWAFFNLFGLTGVQTFKSMFMQAAMPAMVLGFIMCERFKLDTTAYTAVFSLSVVSSIVTIPIWWNLLSKGVFS